MATDRIIFISRQSAIAYNILIIVYWL